LSAADFAPVVFGCAGTSLTPAEKAFFQGVKPLGFILFARNIDSPDQVRTLVRDLRAAIGWDQAPVLIDQEGGRVARLRPPHWRLPPAGAVLGALYRRDRTRGLRAAFLNARLIAADLAELGINVDCLPIADVPQPDAHPIVGDRAYGDTPEPIIAIGQAVMAGLLEGGVAPVLKHIPGHGRARADSHLELPVVEAPLLDLAETDFVPFRALNHAPWGMTAHVVFTALDPARPATTSSRVIDATIRRTLGFDGALMTDDLGMKALGGSFTDRARDSLAAGCDLVLHCSGDMAEMVQVADGLSAMTAAAARRIDAATALPAARPFDVKAGLAELEALLA
jgi:beta-N-acetylhexosaminidase